jgi:hypothetical protein
MFRRDLLHLQGSSVCTVSQHTTAVEVCVPHLSMLVELVRSPDSVGHNIPGMIKKQEASESDVIILTQ